MQEKSFLDYFKEAITKNYVNFEGRARRKEYWGFQLINTIIVVVLTIIGIMINKNLAMLGNIFSLAVLLPSIAVGVRRMHDVGKSGWYILIPIYNLILAFTDGEKGTNQYGPDPKNPGDELETIGTE
jgi:uncharacterized membrane protein YhaH (DUF805 family)